METRVMGRTGLRVGVVGTGLEHFEHASPAEVLAMIHRALDAGANYFDSILAQPAARDAFGAAFAGRRHEAVIAGHLGVYMDGTQMGIGRDPELSLSFYEDQLRRFRTDYFDIVNITFVDEPDDVQRVLAPGGLLEMAIRLKEQGKARFVGVSCHRSTAAKALVSTDLVDALMFSINPLFDLLPGDLVLDNCWHEDSYSTLDPSHQAERLSLYHLCERMGVGISVMKAYAGAWLFSPAMYSTGRPLTSPQCIEYALSRPAVATVACGARKMEELEASLAYCDTSEADRDFAEGVAALRYKPGTTCLYCNHCLPCPEGIDVGRTLRLGDTFAASEGDAAAQALARSEYMTLTSGADVCTSCGTCVARCPFGVEVPARMAHAATLMRG